MTTGRINQVTIVRQGVANRPCFRAEEFSVTGSAGTRPAAWRVAAGVSQPARARMPSAFPF